MPIYGKKILNTVLALLAVAAAGSMSFPWHRHAGIEGLRAEARLRLENYEAVLFAPTDKYSYLPDLVASHPLVVASLQHAASRNAAAHAHIADVFLEHLNTNARSAGIYVLDQKGLVIASSNWQDTLSFVGQNFSYRPYFQDAMRVGSGRFYGLGTTTRLPGYFLSHAVRAGERVIGVAVVKIDISKLDTRWTKSAEHVLVTDENGVIFLSSHADWKYRPMQTLSQEVRNRVKQTRQYDTVLKDVLPIRATSKLGPNEQLIQLDETTADGREQRVDYLLKSSKMQGADWTINVLMPTEEVDTRARWRAFMTSGALAFTILLVMYIRQMRHRVTERERARLALEQAHQTLGEKHSELQKLSEELRLTAITDPLTGAYNRRYFFDTLQKLLSSARRHRLALSIVMIDVDHFKQINDRHGHPAGDKVLQTLTGICKETLRESDVFARIGGEEFAMALPNSDETAARQAAERLRCAIMEREIETDGGLLHITISAGVAQYQEPETAIDQTLKRADEALYEAKHGGRNRVVSK
jgi:two-component system, NtrC family, C4-dicarboxylate transport sensor histidine kinase DctB